MIYVQCWIQSPRNSHYTSPLLSKSKPTLHVFQILSLVVELMFKKEKGPCQNRHWQAPWVLSLPKSEILQEHFLPPSAFPHSITKDVSCLIHHGIYLHHIFQLHGFSFHSEHAFQVFSLHLRFSKPSSCVSYCNLSHPHKPHMETSVHDPRRKQSK